MFEITHGPSHHALDRRVPDHTGPEPKAPARLRKVVASAAAVAAVAAPIALATATPAEASTTRSNCTVTPLKPTAGPQVLVFRDGRWQYDRRVYFNTRVYCVKDRIIRVQDQIWEQDAGPDQYRAQAYTLRTFATAHAVTLSQSRWASQINTEAGPDEYYHRVSFKVATINGVSAWTSFEGSPITAV